jgi:hypothetical protein
LACHHLGKALTPLTLLRGISREHRLPALAPGASSQQQLRQGSAERSSLWGGDAQIEGCRWLAQAHEDFEQLRRTQGLAACADQRQG